MSRPRDTGIAQEANGTTESSHGLSLPGIQRAAQASPARGSSAAASRSRRAIVDDLVPRVAVLGVWAVMIAVYIAVQPGKMLQAATFQSIAGSQQPLVFISLGALCTFVVGEFDLSVASILGLSATIVPVLAVQHGYDLVASSLIALGAGLLAGVVNAFVVVVVGVDGFIVTLGSGSLLLGITLWISGSVPVAGLSVGFSRIALTDFLGLPLSFYYGLAIALLFAYVVSYTPLGRHMTFVGANREVARLAGVRVGKIRFVSYIASAGIASAGGVLVSAALGGFDASSSAEYLLPALSAVFLGTAVIQPGRFNPLGTMIGVYFLASGIAGLQLMGLGGWIVNVFYGLALVIAVSVSSLVRRRKRS
jgi:ribose transport system permease protein